MRQPGRPAASPGEATPCSDDHQNNRHGTTFDDRRYWQNGVRYPAYYLHPNDSHLTGTNDSHTGTDDEQNLHFRENVHTDNMVAPSAAFAANSPWELPRLQPSRNDL